MIHRVKTDIPAKTYLLTFKYCGKRHDAFVISKTLWNESDPMMAVHCEAAKLTGVYAARGETIDLYKVEVMENGKLETIYEKGVKEWKITL